MKYKKMGIFDLIFGEDRNENCQKPMEDQNKVKPFVFKSNQHQRYENGNPVMGIQNCFRTVTLEENIYGCRGYNLNPGDGYIVKIYNDDLGKPLMSDKPMRIYRKMDNTVEFRGYTVEAQSPFGWQDVDYSVYSLIVYYEKGDIVKCTLNMLDRGVSIEYRKVVINKSERQNVSIKEIVAGNPFSLKLAVNVTKCPYNGQSSKVSISEDAVAEINRLAYNGDVTITFSNLCELSSKNLIQSNLVLSPDFIYNSDNMGNEMASAQINEYQGNARKEYISLFQITKQKGKIVSFLINNIPDVEDYYYLIMLMEQ